MRHPLLTVWPNAPAAFRAMAVPSQRNEVALKTFIQHVTDKLAEARRDLQSNYPELDRESAQAHLYTIGEQAGREWWTALEDAAYRGESVPLAAWRSALREHQSSARGLLGRWIRARPSDCPDALKAAAMAQEFGKA